MTWSLKLSHNFVFSLKKIQNFIKMFCIITLAFKKVKYKFQYSKKLSQRACCDGPLTWSWNSFKNWEKKEKYFKIQNFKNFRFFNFWSIFLQFFLYKFIFSKPNLIFWLNLDIISHLTCKKKKKIGIFG